MNKILKSRFEGTVDERGEQILGKIYGKVIRVSDIALALTAATFFMVSLYAELTLTAKDVAILLVIIAFINRLTLKFSVKRENIIEK